jgi:hypothetical protein
MKGERQKNKMCRPMDTRQLGNIPGYGHCTSELLYEVNVPGDECQEVSKQHEGDGCPEATDASLKEV